MAGHVTTGRRGTSYVEVVDDSLTHPSANGAPVAITATSPPQTNATADPYATHPVWLYFLDPEMEAEYTHFHFVESGCYGGKAYCFLAGSVSLFLIFIVYQPRSYPESGDAIGFWAHIPLLVTASLDILLLGALFIPAIVRWREYVILLTVLLHWPSFIISNLLGTAEAYNYTYPFVCFYFCCLIPLPRFFTMLLVLSISPLSAFAACQFGASWYFKTHSHTEITLWPFLFFALATLRVFETRGRKAFAHGHHAREQLVRIDRQIELTQEMVVRYFPATPTAALVRSNGFERHRAYAMAALVVTDLKGFTAFSSTKKPETVIETVRKTFAIYDEAAQRFGVEKVSTVGDSYFAAVFAGLDESNPAASAAGRSARAVAFAFAAIGGASVELPVRVGVHVGDVMGGFVGAAPPKFDLFGPEADLCKRLEQEGDPGVAHVSNACAVLARRALQQTVMTGTSSLGEFWMPQAIALEFADPVDEASLPGSADPADNASLDSHLGLTRAAACKALLALCVDVATLSTSQDPLFQKNDHHHHHNQDLAVEESFGVPINDTESSHGKADRHSGLQIHFVLLRFAGGSVEEKFRVYYAKNGPTAHLMLLVTFLLCYFLLCAQFMLCTDSMTNKLVLFGMWVLTACIGAQAQACIMQGATPRPIVMSLALQGMVAVLYLGGDASCSVEGRGSGTAAYNLRNLATVLWDVAMVVDTLVLERPFVMRTAITCLQSLILVLLIVIRRNIYTDDEVGQWTWMPLVALLAHQMSSFSVDLVERIAFASGEELRLTMRSAKGKELETAERALDVMLPRFATDKILASRRKNVAKAAAAAAASEQDPNEQHGRQTDVTSQLIGTDDSMSFGSGGHQLGGMKIFWLIDFAAVIFFALDDSASHPDATDGLVRSLEVVLKRHPGAVKIKSNGQYVLCAVGLDDSAHVGAARRQSLVSAESGDERGTATIGANAEIALTASQIAVDVVKRVFHGDDARAASASWRVGINAGPVMGAVFGSQGIIFDIFGDTVNSASRVATTAASNTITVSRVVSRLLDMARDANAADVPRAVGERLVAMKGLGSVPTVQLEHHA